MSFLLDRKKDVQTSLIVVAISTNTLETEGIHQVICVAEGARMMVIVNSDVADSLANGVYGIVTGINHTGSKVDKVFVKFDRERVRKQAKAISQYKQNYPGAIPVK